MLPPEGPLDQVVVFSGGDRPHPGVVAHLPARPLAVIAADSGLDHARALGWAVDIVVGDFDSVSAEGLAAATREGITQDRHPRAKDHTDLELALERAWHHPGVGAVVVVASAIGRFDHALSAAMALALPSGAAVRTSGWFGRAELVVVRPHLPWELDGPPGSLLTLVALHGEARGVVTSGLRYPLAAETLLPSSTRGVSNELAGGPASVRLAHGVLLGIRPDVLAPWPEGR